MKDLWIPVTIVAVYMCVRLGVALVFSYLRRRDEERRQELEDELRREDGYNAHTTWLP